MMFLSPGFFIMIGGGIGCLLCLILALRSRSRWEVQRAALLQQLEAEQQNNVPAVDPGRPAGVVTPRQVADGIATPPQVADGIATPPQAAPAAGRTTGAPAVDPGAPDPTLIIGNPPGGFCPNCGAKVEPRMTFCENCGTRLEADLDS